MGLAEPRGPNTWRLRTDMEHVLRAMQQSTDRQRTLAAHGALISDERLRIEVLDLQHIDSVQGRVLVHGQNEQTGRSYLLLEGTGAKIHFIYYTPDIESARSRGELRVNSFARFRRLAGLRRLDIDDYGDAEKLLSNHTYILHNVSELLERGVVPTEEGWGGWLGRYQAALCEAAGALEERAQNKPDRTFVPRPRRNQSRDHER
jgi:hypothetical protein